MTEIKFRRKKISDNERIYGDFDHSFNESSCFHCVATYINIDFENPDEVLLPIYQ